MSGSVQKGQLVGAVEALGPSEAGGQLGDHRLAVLLLRFPGDPAEPWSPWETRQKVFDAEDSADAFYEEESHGKIHFTGEVFGWFTLKAPQGACPYLTWRDEADRKAEEEGVSLSAYDNVMYVSTPAACNWNGIGEVRGGRSSINGNTDPSTMAHELGHNLGLDHASSWSCTEGGVKVAISDDCTTDEYGDPYDVMGLAYRHSNEWDLNRLGILGPENVKTVTTSATYRLKASLFESSEHTELRIPRAWNSDGEAISWYDLEIRQRGGAFEDVSDPSMSGVSIRVTGDLRSVAHTYLIDADPATNSSPLGVGETFEDGSVRITTLSVGLGSAEVSIACQCAPDTAPPSAPEGLAGSVAPTGMQLSWQAGTDNAEVSRYVISRDGEEIATSSTTSFLDTGATPGLHAYVVYAEDEAGNRSEPSAPATLTVPDRSAPTAPVDLTATVTSAGVELRWEPSSDDVGVARYVLSRDSREIGAATGTGFLDRDALSGEHGYFVYAEDAAGNRSWTSNVARVSVAASTQPPAAQHSIEPQAQSPPTRSSRLRLRLERRRNVYVVEAFVRHPPGDLRLGLWIDGRRVSLGRGPKLTARWRPPRGDCRRHRIVARGWSVDGFRARRVAHLLAGSPGACRRPAHRSRLHLDGGWHPRLEGGRR